MAAWFDLDVPIPRDRGAAVDAEEIKLRTEIARRNALMVIIQASRDCIPGLKLTKDAYIGFKIAHGNAEGDIDQARHRLRMFGIYYHSKRTHEWMIEQDEMQVRTPSLALVWQYWRDVLAAREALKNTPVERLTNEWGNDIGEMKTRKRLDAEVAVDRVEALYDSVLRAYEGRAKRTWEQTLTLRVKPPKQRLVVERTRSSPTGYKKTGEYETRADGVRIPIVRKQ
jgi:hypothetical protein